MNENKFKGIAENYKDAKNHLSFEEMIHDQLILHDETENDIIWTSPNYVLFKKHPISIHRDITESKIGIYQGIIIDQDMIIRECIVTNKYIYKFTRHNFGDYTVCVSRNFHLSFTMADYYRFSEDRK